MVQGKCSHGQGNVLTVRGTGDPGQNCYNNINTKLKKQHKYFNKPQDTITKLHENYIKNQFVDLVNNFMEQYIKGSIQIFSLLKFNYSTSVALAR